MKNVIKSILVATSALASLHLGAAEDTTGRIFVAETPDAILCIFNNSQQTRAIFYKTSGVKGDLVRFDGPNGYLLHYDLPTGNLIQNLNPQPGVADCVHQAYSLPTLIKMQRAYKMLSPMPSGDFLEQ